VRISRFESAANCQLGISIVKLSTGEVEMWISLAVRDAERCLPLQIAALHVSRHPTGHVDAGICHRRLRGSCDYRENAVGR
jgi:hypothetical protein